MRDLHFFISERETRGLQSWQQNEKMILDGNAFLVKLPVYNKIKVFLWNALKN